MGRTLPPKKIFQAGQCPKANNIRCCALVGGRFLALASVRPACGRGPSQKSGEKWCLGGDGISCSAPTPKGTRGRWCLTPFGTAQESKTRTRKAPTPQRPKTWEKRENEEKEREGGEKKKTKKEKKNHGTQDSRVVPHRGTNWAALWLTAQIGRDAVLSESYGRGYRPWHCGAPSGPTWSLPLTSGPV